ncbi:hypothetical protein [Chryseobacterium sp. ERMR1:04]|uniref:hypothetical protein n=1 Tax=Chryseobacterium sp. ERMR1:04 TaxID=1705393 RepID=UPI0006C87AC4|nr:hypothetical protein [Chryseobacterium sp. ERMR1:04]KPH13310.1 hypothetical protein AMQ68_12690 [Chryseobacterium sp. ERMR1:04]
MRYYLFIFLNYFSFVAIAQSAPKKMELSKLFINNKEAIGFIESHFKKVAPLTIIERINHPMDHLLFNMVKKNSEEQFTFFGKPIDFIYAFYDDKIKDEFAIYLMLYLKHEDLLMLSKEWGFPKNVSKEDFLGRDYTSLFWGNASAEIVVGRSFVYEYGSDHYRVQLSNIELSRLYGIK